MVMSIAFGMGGMLVVLGQLIFFGASLAFIILGLYALYLAILALKIYIRKNS
jgi:hypothetical protein